MEVREADLGDVRMTTNPAPGVGGNENVGDQPITMGPHAAHDPGKNAYEKKQRQKTSKVWNDFVSDSRRLVVSKNCSVISVKGCLLFKVQVLPQHLVSIWLRVSNMWVPIRSRRL